MAISAGIDLRYPFGMFGAKSFRSWDHWDKSFFWIDSQPGQVAVIGTQITQPRAPPPQQAKTGLAGDPGLCHTGCRRIGNTACPHPISPKKWGHMGISPGDEWGRMGMNGTPRQYPGSPTSRVTAVV